MKRFLPLAFLMALTLTALQAQPERLGQAGAQQLLINSMPRSSAFNGLDVGSVSGIEGSMVNPGGIAATHGTEILFSNTQWLMGSEIEINTFGFSQALGPNSGVLGIALNAYSLGDFVRTTVDLPDGTLGTFSPTVLNLGLSYARQFTERIYVGFTARLISESTPEVTSNGIAFDAGIQYRSGYKDRLKLGIALRNVGPSMKFSGEGLSDRVLFQPNNPYTTTVNLPTARFEIPATLSLGASYDFLIGEKHVITMMGSFISNSFYHDQGGLGLAYNYRDILILRGSFLYEPGIFGRNIGIDERYNAHTGFAGGVTLQVPWKTGKVDLEGNPVFSTFSFDASYRTTSPFNGTLVVGARINI